jgi:lysozyme
MAQPLATAITNTNPNSCVQVQTDRLCKPWAASNEILSFIAEWESGRMNGMTRIFFQDHSHIDAPVSEGFIVLVYADSAGNPTVGCGHLVLPGDHLQVGQTITVERAREFLKKDLRRMEGALNAKIHVPLFQREYDALVSVIFNSGPGQAADELAVIVNQGDYENVPDSIKDFRCGTRLRPRRRSEARIFAEGVYDATH